MSASDTPPLSPDLMRMAFLRRQPVAAQAHIATLTQRTASAVLEWVRRYPLVRAVRVWPVALSVVAAAPFADPDGLATVTRLGLWIFALDDVFDEELFEEAELMRRAARYESLALGESEPCPDDELAAALYEVRAELQSLPLFAPLQQEWTAALRGTLQGMLREYRWRVEHRAGHAGRLPNYQEYTDNGLWSIGIPPHDWATVMAVGDTSAVAHRAHLEVMDREAARCVRLANDLRSHAKEIGEGNINSLLILARSFEQSGVAPAEAAERAKQRVQADIASGLRRLTRLQAGSRTTSGWPEAAIADIARFCCEFYSGHDYHAL